MADTQPPPSPSPSLTPITPQSQTAYSCDTLPAPQNLRIPRTIHRRLSRSPSPLPSPPAGDDEEPMSAFEVVTVEEVRAAERMLDVAVSPRLDPVELTHQPQPPARKLCVRHQRMADEGTNEDLQKSLDALPLEDREDVNSVWTTFSSSPHTRREIILKGILTMCCFSQLSMLSEQLHALIRLDPFSVLPREVALKVLGYLDAISLCRAAQVSRSWRRLADDDVLWRGICEQHIGQKCHKCGWGLPMLERRRKVRAPLSPPPEGTSASSFFKRDLEDYPGSDVERPLKRQRSAEVPLSPSHVQTTPGSSRSITPGLSADFCLPPKRSTSPPTITRPWKNIYSERLTIERNWRRGRCTVRTLKGHTDGVMCLQFSETLQHPSFPVLITGSYDRTARVWNLETGTEIRCLRGHSRAVRALQFDEAKLITGSMDRTIRVWNWRSGKCIRTLEGHTEGVVCLNFDSNVLASGSVDTTVKIWNLRTGDCFTLRGHRDWVNAVQLWDSNVSGDTSGSCSSALRLDNSSPAGTNRLTAPMIDPGKMLFSASDDGTIRLWDLTSRACVRQFTGHVGQVQGLKLLLVDPPCEEEAAAKENANGGTPALPDAHSNGLLPSNPTYPFGAQAPSTFTSYLNDHPGFDMFDFHHHHHLHQETGSTTSTYPLVTDNLTTRLNTHPPTRSPSPVSKGGPIPVLISGSLDNTIRVWDVESGKALKTLFGHIEGVWAVASDKLRLVSASHDRTIKIWVREEGTCIATLVGHRGAVTCLALGDDKIVSGSDDGEVRIWNFADNSTFLPDEPAGIGFH